MPIESWHGDELLAAMKAAGEAGLIASGETLLSRVRSKYGRRGLGVATLRTGLRAIARGRGGTREALRVKNELNTGSLVDPPGGHPRVRTAALLRSVAMERTGEGQRTLGISKGPASKYAGIHEFGGVINGKPWLVFRLLTGEWRKVHRVKIPARPVWRPAYRESQEAMADAFARGASAVIGGYGSAGSSGQLGGENV